MAKQTKNRRLYSIFKAIFKVIFPEFAVELFGHGYYGAVRHGDFAAADADDIIYVDDIRPVRTIEAGVALQFAPNQRERFGRVDGAVPEAQLPVVVETFDVYYLLGGNFSQPAARSYEDIRPRTVGKAVKRARRHGAKIVERYGLDEVAAASTAKASTPYSREAVRKII